MVSSIKKIAFTIFDPKSCQAPTIDSHRSYVIYDLFLMKFEVRNVSLADFRFRNAGFKLENFRIVAWISDPVFQYFLSWRSKKISKTLFLIHKYHKTSCCKIRVRSEQFENPQHEHELSGLEANAPKSKHLIISIFSY